MEEELDSIGGLVSAARFDDEVRHLLHTMHLRRAIVNDVVEDKNLNFLCIWLLPTLASNNGTKYAYELVHYLIH